MKQTIFKSVMAVLVTLFSLNAHAYDVEIDGIYYNLILKSKTAEVTSGDNKYKGEVNIPSSIEKDGVIYPVTSIGSSAFIWCTGLTDITIPNSVTSIGSEAFQFCSGLTSINIPNSVTSIGSSAFDLCTGLTDITIPNSVTSISNGTFANCVKLISVDIPNSITSIGGQAFYGCSDLSSVIIPNAVTRISAQVFYGCTSLTSVTIPNSVTSIEMWAFYGCTSLTSVTIPNSVTSIGIGAFNGCTNLTSVTIPNSVQVIQHEAFSGCSKITDVYCYAEKIPTEYSFSSNIADNIFNGSNIEYATLHVHGASLNSYSTTAPWSGFGKIESLMPMHTITYMVDDEIYKSIEIEEGESIIPEEAPVKKNYSFSGWSEIPATMPAHDVTVTGTFTRAPLVASYKRHLSSQTTGISSVIIGSYVRKSISFNLVNRGEESINVTELVVKDASNYAVVSRNTDASSLGTLAAGNSIGLSVNLTSNITTCYEWHYTYKGQEFVFCSDANDPAMNHDVTYYVDDQIYVTYEYDLGDEIIPEEEPTKEGCTFSGWSEIPETMPDHDVTITGTFTSVDAIEDVIAYDDEYQIYTLDGKPVETLQKGVNIIKYPNGSTQKVFVK